MKPRIHNPSLKNLISAIALSCGLLTASLADAGGETGSACQKEYQNGWQSTLHYPKNGRWTPPRVRAGWCLVWQGENGPSVQ